MAIIALPDNPDVTVALRRSRQARRMSLRVSSLDGRVTLTLPRGVPEKEAHRFLQEKSHWIEEALQKLPDDVLVQPGCVLPIQGKDYRILGKAGAKVAFQDQQLIAPVHHCGAAIRGMLREMARSRAADAVDRYAAMVDRSPGRLALRDTRSRWGSCSSKGDLMVSWRLILAPEHVLDYVVAHEVAHLVHLDHSPRFWSVVERLRPDWRDSRNWLHQYGADLHRYRFEEAD